MGGKETFRSDSNPITPEGTTNYEGWHIKLGHRNPPLDWQHIIEREAKISPSMSPDFTQRLIMHGFVLSLVVSTILIRACER